MEFRHEGRRSARDLCRVRNPVAAAATPSRPGFAVEFHQPDAYDFDYSGVEAPSGN